MNLTGAMQPCGTLFSVTARLSISSPTVGRLMSIKEHGERLDQLCYRLAMTLRSALRIRTRYLLVAMPALVGLLAFGWGLWFLAVLAVGDEGALPPKERIPQVPSGASVVEEGQQCGSGGCWWQVTVTPPAGQSPEDLARAMGLSEERRESPTLLDPGSVYVSTETRHDQLIIHVGYQ